jgi:hypothetical protein
MKEFINMFFLLPKLKMIGALNCITLGVSNYFERINDNDGTYDELFVFFYESDTEDYTELISDITGLSIITLRTKHGYHYLSFKLLSEIQYLDMYRRVYCRIGGYYKTADDGRIRRRDFILRISRKFIYDGKIYNAVSDSPKYYKYCYKDDSGDYSLEHATLYSKFCYVPINIIKKLYNDVEFKGVNGRIRFTFYRTRD